MTEEMFVIRRATPEDSGIAGQICYDAFSTINREHGFPCDFPSVEAAIRMMGMTFSAPGFYCVVAERDGQIQGSNCMDERAIIRGVGPITVAPGGQNNGLGRRADGGGDEPRVGWRSGGNPAGAGGLS